MPDGLEITGIEKLTGGSCDGCNDHRILMSAAVCAANAANPVVCTDAESVNKSYPDFYDDYQKVGGSCQMES